MNQDDSQTDAASGSRPARPDAPSVGRRRFAKVLAPAVLGTLASKPVLGAQYICTVSGHTSGNASVHLIRGVNCSVGKSPALWAVDANWPGPTFTKGALPNLPNCNVPNGSPNALGTLFNGFLTLVATFFYATRNNSGCGVSVRNGPADGFAPASMFQVLVSTDSTEQFRLGRAVVASLLNAAQLGTAYPVSSARIVAMFNAVVNGGTYRVESVNLQLSRSGVIQYLEKLYSPFQG